MDDAGRGARIERYEIATLAAELGFVERAHGELARDTARPADQIALRNLRDRPHVVRLLESRAGGRVVTLLQHVIWALQHRVRRARRWWRRGRPATGAAPAGPIPAVPGPVLSSVPFARSIVDTRPRILIDVTPTARQPHARGGIPRVVRELAAAAVSTGLGLPVVIRDGALHAYFDHPSMQDAITPGPGDVYVILDVFWYFLDEYDVAVRRARASGAAVALVLYDIFPLQFPSFFPPEVPRTFTSGMLNYLSVSDACLTMTACGTDEIRNYLHGIAFPGIDRLRFGHFPLGVGHTPVSSGPVRARILELFDTDRAFLSVGTLEPRKAYTVTLDGCELAWRDGHRFSLVIFGRHGWRAQALRDRIMGHVELNRRLFWIEDATDGELAFAYARCRSLVQSSIGEGYGLPVLEAARYGAPVIASDLPQFREIAGDSITYYRTADPADLAVKIVAALGTDRRAVDLPGHGWSDSMRALAACLVPTEAAAFVRPAAGASDGRPSIHVACCFDDRMAIPAAVVAASVAATTVDAHVTFHMLRPPELSIDIAELKRSLDSDRFDVVDHVIDRDLSSLHRTDQYSDAMYYRFLLPELLTGDRVIYLDSDTMVRRSLRGLFESELNGHPVAAMPDYSLTYHMRDHGIPIHYKGRRILVAEYYADVLGFELTTTPYLNSGVLVMDLAAWRAQGIADRCFAFCREFGELNMADQDALNHILRGDFQPLDPRWNAFSYMFREYFPSAEANLPGIFGGFENRLRTPSGEWQRVLMSWAFDPWIVHFAYRSKPWQANDRRTDYDSEFWDNAFRTPFGRRLSETFGSPSADQAVAA